MMRSVLALVVTLGALPAVAAESAPAHLAGLGSITFPTSATGKAQEHFLRGVTILHSFGWKQARVEFQAAQELDPDFALAYWGEALCYNHPLIAEQDRETPQAVLQRLGETAEARLEKAPTDREKGLLSAVDVLFFGEGDTLARRRVHMEQMRDLHAEHPEDQEVAAFYALSLLMSAGAAKDPQRRNVLAGAIALRLLDDNPNHPGAAHYAIHAFDDPVHAPLALPAAHVFAKIAEKVSHARHMPSHIFIQHGMWDRVSSSNQSAYEAAVDQWEPGDSLGDMLHSLDWGQYGDLQRGDYQRAELWIERLEGIAERSEQQQFTEHMLAQARSRLVIEREAWHGEAVTEEDPPTRLLAAGLSAVRTDDLALAEKVARILAEAVAAETSGDTDRSYYARNSKPLQIMAKEVGGLLAIAGGQTDTGIGLLAEGVAIAESMRPPNGAPNPLKPVHELYGEALLAAGRPADALAAFETSLRRTPNRPLSLRGLARSHVALGDHSAAKAVYTSLVEGWRDREVPWRQEAEGYLANHRER